MLQKEWGGWQKEKGRKFSRINYEKAKDPRLLCLWQIIRTYITKDSLSSVFDQIQKWTEKQTQRRKAGCSKIHNRRNLVFYKQGRLDAEWDLRIQRKGISWVQGQGNGALQKLQKKFYALTIQKTFEKLWADQWKKCSRRPEQKKWYSDEYYSRVQKTKSFSLPYLWKIVWIDKFTHPPENMWKKVHQ